MLLSAEAFQAIQSNIVRYRKRLTEFCSELFKVADKLGIQYIILYGSVARIDISESSDIDLLLLVDGKLRPYEVENFILHEFPVETEKRFNDDIELDVHVMRTERFKNMDAENPYEVCVNKDGVVIWRRGLS